MAQKKTMSTNYNINDATSTHNATSNTKNYIRVINACFHPDNFEPFLKINDHKDRNDFEVGNGAKNDNFWSMVSDFQNDLDNKTINNFLHIEDYDSNPQYIIYLKEAIDAGHIPTGCVQQTGNSCRTIINGLIKIRGSMINNMKKSGTHSDDPWAYTVAAIGRHALTKTCSRFAAYYFYIQCREHPTMDSCLTRFLDSSVKCDSTSNHLDVTTIITKNSNINSKMHLATLIYQVADISTTFKLQSSTNEYYKIIQMMSADPSMSNKFPIMKRRMMELEKIIYPSVSIPTVPGTIEIGDSDSHGSPISSTPLKKKSRCNLNGSEQSTLNYNKENDNDLSDADTLSNNGNQFFWDDE
jgi:hypothetical protein